jgi:signal transduction histidine kinase
MRWRPWIALAFVLLIYISGQAQEFLDKQQLLTQLSTTPEDTSRVLLYISLGQQYENNQPDSAIYYYMLARDLSKQLDYVTGTLKYISNITYVLNVQGSYDSALQLNLSSVELARNRGNLMQLGACLGNVANSYLYLEKYENAVEYFLQASEYIGKAGNKQYQGILFNNMAIIYIKLKQPEKAVEYAVKAVAIARETEDLNNLAVDLDNLALAVMETGEFQKAIPYLMEGLSVAEKTDNIYVKESIFINLADVHRRLGDFDNIRSFAEQGASLARELEDVAGEATAYLGLGYYYLSQNNLQEALKYANLSAEKSSSINSWEQLAGAYSLHGLIALSKNQHLVFQSYNNKRDSIELLAVNDRIMKNIQDLETKYETEKKMRQINQLEQEKSQQKLKLTRNRFVLITLGGVTITILIIGLLLIRGYSQKQLILKQEKELSEKRISELETEKMLEVAEAVLKGQDQERTRLARDLHDGLGGMLSGIKLSFLNLMETKARNTDDKQLFHRSVDMLDGSIRELRRVAHNMMPEILLKFGLDTALRDYCEKISESGTLSISYQSFNLENIQVGQTIQITIYRIVQELINNVVRHAGASNVFVQLARIDNRLTISVEDDGCGFDVSILDQSPGIGWANTSNRVDYLLGKIDIQSSKNKGTTVNIELDL